MKQDGINVLPFSFEMRHSYLYLHYVVFWYMSRQIATRGIAFGQMKVIPIYLVCARLLWCLLYDYDFVCIDIGSLHWTEMTFELHKIYFCVL